MIQQIVMWEKKIYNQWSKTLKEKWKSWQLCESVPVSYVILKEWKAQYSLRKYMVLYRILHRLVKTHICLNLYLYRFRTSDRCRQFKCLSFYWNADYPMSSLTSRLELETKWKQIMSYNEDDELVWCVYCQLKFPMSYWCFCQAICVENSHQSNVSNLFPFRRAT